MSECLPVCVCVCVTQVIMKDMFGGSVMDFAWTPDGMTLLAASYDGTIATVSFTEAELGREHTHTHRHTHRRAWFSHAGRLVSCVVV